MITHAEHLREPDDSCRLVTTLNKDNYLNEWLSHT